VRQVIEPGLIAPAEWQRVQDILNAKEETNRHAMKGGHTTYQGFLFCDKCGSIMTPYGNAGPSRGKYGSSYWYQCQGRRRKTCDQKRVKAPVIDAQIDALLATEVTSLAFARRIVMGIEARSKDEREQDRVRRLERERKELVAQRAQVLKQHRHGYITDGELDEAVAEIAAQLSKVDHELALAQPNAALPKFGVEELMALFQPFAEWECCTSEEKRRLLTVYIPRLRVRDDAVASLFRLLDAREVAVSAATWQGSANCAPCSNQKLTAYRPSASTTPTEKRKTYGKAPLSADAPIAVPGVWIDLAGLIPARL
jgi:hypothetical protein